MNYSLTQCPICTYDRNPFNAESCELCETSLAETGKLATIASPLQFNKMKSNVLEAVSVVPRAEDSFREMKAWLLEWSKSQAEKTKSFVSTARSAQMYLRNHLANVDLSSNKDSATKLLEPAKPKDTAPDPICSDPWFTDSPQPELPSKSKLASNRVEKKDSQALKQQLNNVSKLVANRFTSSKTHTVAKTILMLTAMFGVSSITTVFIYNQYVREQSITWEKQSPSLYSDIKLYDTMQNVPNVPEGLFSYGGALCFAALQRDGMNAAIAEAHPSFSLRYVEPRASNPGCTTGIKMLLEGELSIAQNSRPLTAGEINVANSRGYQLESVPVALDGIAFYTHKSLGVKSLSLQQVKDIYLGKITNWKQLGGKDLPITPIGLDPQIDSILRLLMETNHAPAIGENVVIARDFTSAVRETSSTPGAISYASSAVLKGQSSIAPVALSANNNSPSVSAILADGTVNLQAFEKNVYPLTRRLYVVIRRDGSPDEKAGTAYTNLLLSKEGQKIVKKAGFVPLFSDDTSKSQ